MNREHDYFEFSKFMIEMGSVTPQGIPSTEKIEGLFQLLQDMDLKTVMINTRQAIKAKGFFPLVSDIRQTSGQDDRLEIEAQKAWNFLDNALDYANSLGSGFDIVMLKLESWNRPDLKEYVRIFGREIVEASNITATRAQFLKNYKAHQAEKHLELESGKPKELNPHVKEMLAKIG